MCPPITWLPALLGGENHLILLSHGAANGAELTQACQPGMPAGPGTPKNWASNQNRPQARQMPSPCPISPGLKLTKVYFWGISPGSAQGLILTHHSGSGLLMAGTHLWCRELNPYTRKVPYPLCILAPTYPTYCAFSLPPITCPLSISRPPLVLVFFQTCLVGAAGRSHQPVSNWGISPSPQAARVCKWKPEGSEKVLVTDSAQGETPSAALLPASPGLWARLKAGGRQELCPRLRVPLPGHLISASPLPSRSYRDTAREGCAGGCMNNRTEICLVINRDSA